MGWERYRSRKFLMSLLVLTATVVLAYFGKMDAHVGLVLAGLVSSYNVMQGWIDQTNVK